MVIGPQADSSIDATDTATPGRCSLLYNLRQRISASHMVRNPGGDLRGGRPRTHSACGDTSDPRGSRSQARRSHRSRTRGLCLVKVLY